VSQPRDDRQDDLFGPSLDQIITPDAPADGEGSSPLPSCLAP
jgi:hypothetical protein